jgi:hypothetical protein
MNKQTSANTNSNKNLSSLDLKKSLND